MSPDTVATVAAAAVIVAFLWTLHRDVRALDARIGQLGERLARLEGKVEVLTRFLVDRERDREATP